MINSRISIVADDHCKKTLLQKIQGLMDGMIEFNTKWIEQHGWAAVPVADSLNDMDAEWISEASRLHGNERAFAIPTQEQVTQPWFYVALEQDALLSLDSRISQQSYILVPEDVGFAILLEGDYFFVVAGPRDFVLRSIGCSFKTAKAMFVDRYIEANDWPESTREMLLKTWQRYEPFR